MVRIASHLQNHPYRPTQKWPDGTSVQWGGDGVVLGEKPYRTAFFEAFPKDGSAGFIRGEGQTIADAEAHAHAQWSKNAHCMNTGGHSWSRNRPRKNGTFETYTNGGCFCRKCGSFQTVMAPIVQLGSFRDPLTASELNAIADGYCRPSPWSKEDRDGFKWRRRLILKARKSGIDLPEMTPRDPDRAPFDEDLYEKGCRQAVAWYLIHHSEILPALESQNSHETNHVLQLFDSVYGNSLKRLVDQYKREQGQAENTPPTAATPGMMP